MTAPPRRNVERAARDLAAERDQIDDRLPPPWALDDLARAHEARSIHARIEAMALHLASTARGTDLDTMLDAHEDLELAMRSGVPRLRALRGGR